MVDHLHLKHDGLHLLDYFLLFNGKPVHQPTILLWCQFPSFLSIEQPLEGSLIICQGTEICHLRKVFLWFDLSTFRRTETNFPVHSDPVQNSFVRWQSRSRFPFKDSYSRRWYMPRVIRIIQHSVSPPTSFAEAGRKRLSRYRWLDDVWK